ncbi:DHA2 family efflux MFS transporter permease subunit [Nocardioides sp.]|uniref:DHA2 family efflux MFS transporter permease subunit n=1 Tax=Nocardioides sp. TaxID=35761 RepID=UPI001A354207|nr:DHA2 family efflux MFS transporter permease subunit [Nocardioides sp.]MBJ7358156.1 DHA2 family efflux MFS transporter permease subunit [Nocardioides sp.]
MPLLRSKPAILATVCVAVLVINLNTTIVNIALPTLSTELDAGTRELLWIVDGYNLSFAALVLAAGSLSDRFGRRPALVLGLLGFGLASTASALVESAGALVATRFAAGVCAAVIFPATLSVIANAFTERRERAAALGIWGAATGVGVATGPVAGGWLLEHYSWQSVFWAMVPVAAAAIAMTLAFVPESRDPGVPPLDRRGLLVSVALLGLLTWTIIEAPEAGWTSAQTLLGFAGTVLLLAAFVRLELRAPHPMLDLSLFRDRRFSAAATAVTISTFALFGFIFLITQFFQFVRDYSALGTGTRILPVAGAIAGASVLGGFLAPRVGVKAVVTVGMTMLGCSFVWVSTMAADASYAEEIVPMMLLMGTGLGLISTPATESIMQVLPPARAGVGSAVNDATRELGGTLGVAVVGSLFSSLYAARLVELLEGRLPAEQLAAAEESVGVADAIGAQVAGVATAMEDAFMAGLGTASLVVGLLCLAGGLFSAVALPGNRFVPPADRETQAAPQPEPVAVEIG